MIKTERFFWNKREDANLEVTYPYYRKREILNDYTEETHYELVGPTSTLRIEVKTELHSKTRYAIDTYANVYTAYWNGALDYLLGRGEFESDAQEFNSVYEQAFRHFNEAVK